MVVSRAIKKRGSNFTAKFPDAIELLVRGLRSGLPVTETMNVVAQEVPGPVGEEFKMVSERIRIGRTMEEALQETADRLDTPEFSFFVITLAIPARDRRQPAETLSNLADVLRKRAQMKLKIRAMSSGIEGFGLHRRSAAVHRLHHDLVINPSYIGGFFVDDRLIVTASAAGVDEHWRLHHGQDGQLRNLTAGNTIMLNPSAGPTLLGFDVIWIGTLLVGGASWP
jgi:tight adherence protein B